MAEQNKANESKQSKLIKKVFNETLLKMQKIVTNIP